MPNGWLARAKLIDEELLVDPGLDTCEDLYFELQIAQRAHFAFSVEVTAIHHFHHLGNSTIDDSHKHLPDTQRIALRNFSRTFPKDSVYDIADKFRLIGKQYKPGNQIQYRDPYLSTLEVDYTCNSFYPFRAFTGHPGAVYVGGASQKASILKALIRKELLLPFKLLAYAYRFIRLDKRRKNDYLAKFKRNVHEHGLLTTLIKLNSLIKRGQVVGISEPVRRSWWLTKMKVLVRLFRLPIKVSQTEGRD